MIGWKKKTVCAPHWTKVLTNYIGFSSFLDKEESSLIGKLNYHIILIWVLKEGEPIFLRLIFLC